MAKRILRKLETVVRKSPSAIATGTPGDGSLDVGEHHQRPIYNLVRNPYYVGVDPEGNQLPPIDNLNLITYQSPDALNMAAIQGEIDILDRHIIIQNYPVLIKESEDKQ